MGIKYRKLKKAFFEMFTGEPEENGNSIMEEGARIIKSTLDPKSKHYIKTHTNFDTANITCMIEGYEYEFFGGDYTINRGMFMHLPPLSFNDVNWERTTRCECRKRCDVSMEVGMRETAETCIAKYLKQSKYDWTRRGDRAIYYKISDDDNTYDVKVDVLEEPHKNACVTCGTCMGWSMSVMVNNRHITGKKDMKRVDIGKYLLYDALSEFEKRNAKEQVAKDICRE